MPKKNPFEELKKEFPIFRIKNRTNVPQIIKLAGDDSVQVPANTTIRVESANLIQVPNMNIFRPVSPSTEDYQMAGVLPTGTKEKKATAPASGSGSSGSGSGSSGSGSSGSGSGSGSSSSSGSSSGSKKS